MTFLVVALVLVAVAAAAGGVYFYVLRSRRSGALLEPPKKPEVTAYKAPTTPQTRPTTEPPVVERPSDVAPADEAHAPGADAPDAPEVSDEIDAEGIDEFQPEPIGERPRFRDRLSKARTLLGGYFGSVLGRTAIDSETWDELEEALIRADVGVGTTTSLLDDLRGRVKQDGNKDSSELLDALKTDLKKRLVVADRTLRFEPGRPNVWLFVGVNGVGKTTTIGKIARREIANGRTVVMAAGDTFRAAAAEQLGMWADRTGAQFVRGSEGGDPGSVIFDAVERAAARNIELVLGDTAGRLQTKTNLMEELRKIRRVADRDPGIVTEVLLVLDATTGQNGLVQAKQFSDVAELTGVVLTKLDGTAKGGIALAIQTELGIPIKLVGLGEGMDDLITFDPDEYVDALFAS